MPDAVTILAVDDSATMRRIIRNGLRAVGYEAVLEAENGRAGLAKLRRAAVDVVITDWAMPVMGGLEMVRAIRSNPATRHLPVLMIAAGGRQDDIDEALEAGITGYIATPFEAETLHRKVQQALGQS